MGNYLFETSTLLKELYQDADREDSQHDFGFDILPSMFPNQPVFACNFLENRNEGETGHDRGYWRDVGTIDAYFGAAMDLRSPLPYLNLYNPNWPLRTAEYL